MKSSTGKFVILGLVILSAAAFMVFQYLKPGENEAVYEGTIIGTSKNGAYTTILMDGAYTRADGVKDIVVTTFSLPGDFRLTNDEDLSVNDLKVGNYIRLSGSDTIKTSYPAQADADAVEILEEISPESMIEGEVMEVIPGEGGPLFTFLVKGSVTGYGDDTEVYVAVPKTAFVSHGLKDGSGSSLRPGDRVMVLTTGGMRESYPMQTDASSVIILQAAE